MDNSITYCLKQQDQDISRYCVIMCKDNFKYLQHLNTDWQLRVTLK